jgi:hypothetical protein
MVDRVRSTLSFANVVSVIALFVALGGVSYAAVTLPANSVGTKQIKNKAVTRAKIAPKTLASLRGPRGAAGPAGAQGPGGAQGPAGARGPAGVAGGGVATTVVRWGSPVLVDHGVRFVAAAQCHAGEVATSGGWTVDPASDQTPAAVAGNPTSGGTPVGLGAIGVTPDGWRIHGFVYADAQQVYPYVICAGPA